jgi:hypothetical protein
MKKSCWQKAKDLEEKVKNLEGYVPIGWMTNLQHRTSKGKRNKYVFYVSAS